MVSSLTHNYEFVIREAVLWSWNRVQASFMFARLPLQYIGLISLASTGLVTNKVH